MILVAIVLPKNPFVLVFMGYRTIIARYVAKIGYRTDVACVKLSTKGGIAPFGGSANLPEKVSRDMGYHGDSIAISRDMGPLSVQMLVVHGVCKHCVGQETAYSRIKNACSVSMRGN